MSKIIAWWSGGITSAVTCKICIDLYGLENVRFIFIDTRNEDDDTYRFLKDCEELKKLLLLYTDRVNDDKARTELFMSYLISNSSLLDFDFKKVGIEL